MAVEYPPDVWMGVIGPYGEPVSPVRMGGSVEQDNGSKDSEFSIRC